MLRRGMAMILFPATCKCSSPVARMQASPRVTFRNTFCIVESLHNFLTVNAKCFHNISFIYFDIRLYHYQERVVVIVLLKVRGGLSFSSSPISEQFLEIYTNYISSHDSLTGTLYNCITVQPGRHHVRHLCLPSVCFQNPSSNV